MQKIKKSWDFMSKEQRDDFVKEIIEFFLLKQEKKITLFEAEEILDFFLENLESKIYNRAIFDARNVLARNNENLQIDLDLLMKK
ncbi:MAG: DUF2164 family protein [Patescibacteria group bacterium]